MARAHGLECEVRRPGLRNRIDRLPRDGSRTVRLRCGNSLSVQGAAEPISRVDRPRSRFVHRWLKTETSTCGVPCYAPMIHAFWSGALARPPVPESIPMRKRAWDVPDDLHGGSR